MNIIKFVAKVCATPAVMILTLLQWVSLFFVSCTAVIFSLLSGLFNALRRCLPFIGGFFPLLLIFFQIPIQIDLVDGGHDRVAEKILCVGSGMGVFPRSSSDFLSVLYIVSSL